MRVAWEVAPGVDPSADSLGKVSGIAVDLLGNVYASDFLSSKVWIFDGEGRLQGSVGRKGQGPGEFQSPAGVAVGPRGDLWVRDIDHVSRFGIDSTTGFLDKFVGSFDGPLYSDWAWMRTIRFNASGDLFYPSRHWSVGSRAARTFVIRYTPDGHLEDTLFVPDYANAPPLTAFIPLGPRGGRMLAGLNHVPFAALPVWDVTLAGTIVSGDGLIYQLQETDSQGIVVRTFGRDLPLESIPDAERDDSVRALRSRIDSIPGSIERVEGMPKEVRSLELPTVYPAYIAVGVGHEGSIWVRRWPPEGMQETVFDVFAPSGEFEGTIRLPRWIVLEPTPFLSRSCVVGVALDPTTGESAIIQFRPNEP